MKIKTLLFAALAGLFFVKSPAQIVNGSFENWQTDTTIFKGFPPALPVDTYSYVDPVAWTSSNAISAMSIAGGFSFAEQSNNSFAGQHAIMIRTDTTAPINVPFVGKQTLTLPGFVLNGKFPIDFTTWFTSGINITPTSIKGSGQAFNKRLAKIKGEYNYTPVYNPNTHGNDTCIVWAVLRKGTQPIASAIFKSTDSTKGYRAFEASFQYVSCDLPDTLVILIGSSIPYVPQLINGKSNLVRGSVLLVDTLNYDTLSADYNFTPFARFDTASTIKNTPKNILVKANDEDCNDGVNTLVINVTKQPAHGNAAPDVYNTYVTYTPATDYFGQDTFAYTINDGTNTSAPANVAVTVRDNVGIDEIGDISLNVYPVPAKNELHVKFDYKGACIARIYNITGAVVNEYTLTGNENVIPLNQIADGLYGLEIVNNRNEIIAHSKFAVSK